MTHFLKHGFVFDIWIEQKEYFQLEGTYNDLHDPTAWPLQSEQS